MTKSLSASRLAGLKNRLHAGQAVLLTNPADITYYAGFRSLVPEEREGFLLVTPQLTYLFHASFSPVPENSGLVLLVGTSTQALTKYLRELQETIGLKEIFIDKLRLFAYEYEALLKLENCTLTNLDPLWSWSQRMVKDESEILLLRKAAKIARNAFKKLQSKLKVGITEVEVQRLLEIEMIKLGSEKVAFPTIVCFGDHGALPHHQPTSTRLEKEMPVLIDFGATVNDYRSDMTRSFWFGDEPSPEFIQIEKLIHKAYQACVTYLKKPRTEINFTAAELDDTARSIISQAGFGKHFIHTTGHGVGIEIHEPPSLNWTNPLPLEPGMVVTIEPGIYLENKFGYRYENTLLITESGASELTL